MTGIYYDNEMQKCVMLRRDSTFVLLQESRGGFSTIGKEQSLVESGWPSPLVSVVSLDQSQILRVQV